MKGKNSIKEIGIELVQGCDLNCRMCPILKPSRPRYITIEQLTVILDSLKSIRDRKRLFLVGRGEALLHPGLEEIFFLLEQKQVGKMFPYRYLYTNATLLTPDIIKIICRYNVLNELVFSLHGQGDEETYEYWCGKNSWRTVVEGIKNFVKFYKENKKYGINYRISVIIPDYTMVPYAPLPQGEILKRFQNIFGKDMPVVFRSLHDYDGQNGLFPDKKYIKNSCYRLLEGDWNFKIDGNIIPCCAVANCSEEAIIGNINQESIKEIYYGEKFQNMKGLLSTNQRDKLEMCKKCTLLSYPEEADKLFIKVKKSLSCLKLRLKQLIPAGPKKFFKKNIFRKDIRSQDRLDCLAEIKSQISQDPLNEQLHLQLGWAYSDIGYIDQAIACFRTANYLGATIDYRLITQSIPDLFELPVDQYIRFKAVADAINSKYKGISVLDVGGGGGLLGYFFPKQKYILADIKENGITAFPLPFKDKSIEVICTTDTLEHIPRRLREKFISEIIRVAKKEIHIVVPTMLPEGYPDYNEFFYKMTGAFQTKEHLEYGVPTLNELHLLLEPYKNVVSYEMVPCGSLINTALLLHHYLIDRDKQSKLIEISRYFNKHFYKEIKNGVLPIGHHIKIKKGS